MKSFPTLRIRMLLAVLALTGVITVTQVVILSVFQGLINAFDMPTRQALVVHMVDDRADLANAIALNSSMVNGARLVGPSVAGVLIAVAGEGWCFLGNGVSYLAVIGGFLLMRMEGRRGAGSWPRERRKRSPRRPAPSRERISERPSTAGGRRGRTARTWPSRTSRAT
ncbi:MAG: MFS transporter [Candidatus Aminicenantes bacterium]|nr:MFS transporter [Candidatus Aminicenantes bacterium]